MESTEMTRTVTRRKICIIIFRFDNLKMSVIRLISSRSLQTLFNVYLCRLSRLQLSLTTFVFSTLLSLVHWSHVTINCLLIHLSIYLLS